jgi:antirestriction protein ArdC
MPKASWFDDSTDLPVIDEQVAKLESFAAAMADGIVEKHELTSQQAALVETMRTVEGMLTDEQHAAVTRLLVEMSAYNVMRTVHELQADRLQRSLAG